MSERPADVALAPIDWSLRGTGWFNSAYRWCCVLTPALCAVGGLGGSVAAGVEALQGHVELAVPAVGGGMALFPLAIAAALFDNWAIGRGGRWGDAVSRLARDFPSTLGRIRGRFSILPGLRLPHSRPALLLFAPYRCVVVSHGWNPIAMTFLVSYAAFFVSIGLRLVLELTPLLIPTLFIGVFVLFPSFLLAVILVGRGVELHEVPYDDASIDRGETVTRFRVDGGRLEPGFEYRPRLEDRVRFLDQAATRWPRELTAPVESASAAGDDPSAAAARLLAGLQQRYEDP